MKKCENPNCHAEQAEFYFNKNNADGLDNRCKECKREDKRREPKRARQQRGSPQLAAQIRQLWVSSSISYRDLCDKFGFDVYNIIRNKNWYDPDYVRPEKKPGRK